MNERRRSALRFLAPLALIAFAFALLLVVSSADVSDDGGSSTAGEEAEERDLESREERRERRREREEDEGELPQDVYIVKEGDTLGSIAERTGVPVEKLQELNPQLDPQALVTGQEVRLRE